MYDIIYTNHFKHSLKKCVKQGRDVEIFRKALNILQCDGRLPGYYKPHKLSGKYNGLWECHLQPDWLMVWDQNDKELTLLLLDIGSHSDLF